MVSWTTRLIWVETVAAEQSLVETLPIPARFDTLFQACAAVTVLVVGFSFELCWSEGR